MGATKVYETCLGDFKGNAGRAGVNNLRRAIEDEFFSFKARIACVCEKFKPGLRDYNCLWVECANCGNWKFFTLLELIELFSNRVPRRRLNFKEV